MSSERFLELSVKVFAILSWVALVFMMGVGLYLIVVGGDPVPIGNTDFELPARVLGFLWCIPAAWYFFVLRLASYVLWLLLDIRAQLRR